VGNSESPKNSEEKIKLCVNGTTKRQLRFAFTAFPSSLFPYMYIHIHIHIVNPNKKTVLFIYVYDIEI
jgi:hypothetical protein